jgi:hypothetical protein
MAVTMLDILNWVMVVVMLGLVFLGVTNTMKINEMQDQTTEQRDLFTALNGGEWVCVAEKCVEWAQGDQWIADNCLPSDSQGERQCTLTVDGMEYRAPLSIINLSIVKSCHRKECAGQVYVKTGPEVN